MLNTSFNPRLLSTSNTYTHHTKRNFSQFYFTRTIIKYACALQNQQKISVKNWCCFFIHRNHTDISFSFRISLIRWNAGCSISMLFVDFSVKPLKSQAQISSNDKLKLFLNIKTTSFPLQVCSLRLINCCEHFAMITRLFAYI